jgi:poly-gamma-glutamate capsule biosynthesis protein CapA/YwtB (metallophosphatase superfamily)
MILRFIKIFTLFLFTSCEDEPELKREKHPPQYNADFLTQKQEKTHEPQTLRLMFAGDIMSQLQQLQSANIGGENYDFTHCFQYVKPIFAQADLVIGNLECTLADQPPYTGFPMFKSPNQLAEAVKNGGFDVLMMSNNHSLDGGLEGILHTNNVVRKQGFMQTGTFADTLQRKIFYPLIVYKNGFKIALLNYTHHTNGLPQKPPTIVNRLVMKEVKRDIEEAKLMQPDFIVTFLHWGDEYQLDESSEQRGVAAVLHEWGSDLVIGSHPHVVQPIKNELIAINKKEVNCLTAYSLGNFISAQPYPNTEGGIVFEVNLKKENGVVEIEDYFYIPIIRYTPYEQGRIKYYALPISPIEGHENELKMSATEQVKMTNWVAKMRVHLGRFGAVEKKFKWDEMMPN